jgi:hypothetical protein
MRRVTAVVVCVMALLALAGTGHAQDDDDTFVGGSNDGEDVTGDVEVVLPGETGGDGGGGGGPICHYEEPRYTTQEDQREEIRPEETRPGVWGWLVCDDGTEQFIFFPDEAPIDPTVLARSVNLTPPAPDLRTNPDADATSLVNLETWFWAAGGSAPMSQSASVGPVTVTVGATPRVLVVDPGDGSESFACTDFGTPYDTARPAQSQSTTCGYTYSRPGQYTATATLIYDVGFTSNVGVGGGLGTIEPSSSVTVTVQESQAVVTR